MSPPFCRGRNAWFSLKSPGRHRRKAMVLLVPSVMSRTPMAGPLSMNRPWVGDARHAFTGKAALNRKACAVERSSFTGLPEGPSSPTARERPGRKLLIRWRWRGLSGNCRTAVSRCRSMKLQALRSGCSKYGQEERMRGSRTPTSLEHRMGCRRSERRSHQGRFVGGVVMGATTSDLLPVVRA